MKKSNNVKFHFLKITFTTPRLDDWRTHVSGNHPDKNNWLHETRLQQDFPAFDYFIMNPCSLHGFQSWKTMHLVPEGHLRVEAQFKIKTKKNRIIHQLPFCMCLYPSLSSPSTTFLKDPENKQELHLKNKAPWLYRFQFHRYNPSFYSSLPGKGIKTMKLGL